MGFSTVLIISLAAGVILIIGGGLMMYMANLVKSAYEIKVQINTDVEDRLTKMGEDLDKKSRWIKRDLLEEIEKIKVALQTDNARRIEELTGPLQAKVDGFETLLRNERAEWVKAVEADRAAIASLDSRLKIQPKKKPEEPAKPGEAAAVNATAAAADAIMPAAPGAAPGAAPPSPPPAEAAAPSRPTGPTPVGNFLQELGNGR
jgi:Fe2+ transport system protein FeoA